MKTDSATAADVQAGRCSLHRFVGPLAHVEKILRQREKLNDLLEAQRRTEMVTIGETLRAWRVGKKVSLRAVARKAGVSAPYVSDVELGRRNVSMALLLAYASFYVPNVSSQLPRPGTRSTTPKTLQPISTPTTRRVGVSWTALLGILE